MDAISSILSDEPEVEAPLDEVKDDKQVEVKTEEVKPDTAAPSVAKEEIQSTDKPVNVPLSANEHVALIALKAKAKDLERQLAEAKQGKPEENADFYADPDKSVEIKVKQLVAPIRERFFKQSISAAATAHTDFQQAAEAFDKMLEANPALHSQWMESDDPGEFIYSVGTNTPEHRETYSAALRAQLKERDDKIAALSAQVEQLTKTQAELASIPVSLNGRPSGVPQAAETDDEDVAQIARFNQRK